MGALLDALEARGQDLARARGHLGPADLEIPVRWNARLRVTAGRAKCRCDTGERWVELNPLLVEEGDAALANTLLHEVAHLLAGIAEGHGLAWKAQMYRLGVAPSRCHSYASMKANRRRRPRRVVAVCGKCGFQLERTKALPSGRRYLHRGCGGRFVPHAGTGELVEATSRNLAG